MKSRFIEIAIVVFLGLLIPCLRYQNSSAISIDNLKKKVPSVCSDSPNTWNSAHKIITSIDRLRVFGYCGFHLFDGTNNESNSLFYPFFTFNQATCKDCTLAPAGLNYYPALDSKVTSGYYRTHSQGKNTSARKLDDTDIPYYYRPHFMCQQPGSSCPKLGTLTDSIYFTSCPKLNNVSSNYYWVYITAGDNDAGNDTQNIAGYIEQPIYHTLTVLSRDTNRQSLDNVTSLGGRATTVRGGSAASVSHANSNTGYIFKEWRDANWNYIGNQDLATYTIQSLTSDVVIYAVYEAYDKSSSIDIKIKNDDVNNYSTFKDGTDGSPIYAKPGDIISFHTDYKSTAQLGASLKPQRIAINNTLRSSGNNTTSTLEQLYNAYKPSGGNWDNAFTVSSKNTFRANNYYRAHDEFVNGQEQTGTDDNQHTINKFEVGKKSPSETAATSNSEPGIGTTPGRVFVSLSNGLSLGNVITNLNDTAKAFVPYNFTTDSEITTEPESHYLYAGESSSINYKINLEEKTNCVTTNDCSAYTTVADNVQRQLIIYNPKLVTNPYRQTGTIEGDRNTNICSFFGYNGSEESCDISQATTESQLDPETVAGEDFKTNFYVQDIAAGSEICIAVALFPATSGADTNWNDTEFYRDSSGRSYWRVSNSKCYTIAKRPSIQFWGGNVYSRGNLSTSTALKNNLAGYPQYAYNAKQSKGTFVFGSWGELGVVGNGTISGFGSGASMGYAKNSDGTVWQKYQFTGADGTAKSYRGAGNNAAILGEPGGGRTSSFCNRILLTIPNSPCSSTVGGMSSAIAITNATSDKNYIVELLASGKSTTNHSHSSSDRDVSKADIGEEIDGSTTKVISSDGNITITSDLDYLIGEYKNYGQMPKLVIYSKQNIYINCEVGRIDALLIANDTVVTCKNFDDTLTSDHVADHINDEANSNQLIVNGAIIAKRLIPNRTYGAATGANSIVPSEVVNFDPTLYQFGSSAETDDDTTGRLDITYIHEIAPRI